LFAEEASRGPASTTATAGSTGEAAKERDASRIRGIDSALRGGERGEREYRDLRLRSDDYKD
jgi:hypothetical protein